MRFPQNDYLKDYKDSDFGSAVSTMLIDGMVGSGYDFELGDSGVHVELQPMVPGPAGMENFKADCNMVREKLNEAVPHMSEPYKQFWAFMTEEFDKNGVTMPHVGKVL